VIYCASLRKTLAPGLRLGWIAGGRWQARIQMLKYAQSRANEALAQHAVAEFMASSAYDRHMAAASQLNAQREQMAEAIAAHFPAGTRLSVPKGQHDVVGGVARRHLGTGRVRHRHQAGHTRRAGLHVFEFKPLRPLFAHQLRRAVHQPGR
jgi:hypothetical protein